MEHDDMLTDHPGRVVIGPSGKPLTFEDLPPADTKRWVPRRNAELVAAVRGGLISLEDACQRYGISVEEFLSWAEALGNFGVNGLRSTRLQLYRKTHPQNRNLDD